MFSVGLRRTLHRPFARFSHSRPCCAGQRVQNEVHRVLYGILRKAEVSAVDVPDAGRVDLSIAAPTVLDRRSEDEATLHEALNKRGSHLAWQAYRQLRLHTPERSVSLTLLRALFDLFLDKRETDWAWAVIVDLTRAGHKTRGFRARLAIVESLTRRGLDEAIERLQILFKETGEVDRATANRLISAYVPRNNVTREDVEKAARLFERLEREFGVKHDIVAYNCLMNGHAKRLDMDSAYSLLQIMVQKEVRPNVVTYNILMNLCAKRGARQDVEKLYSQMIDLKVKPTSRTYSALVDVCGQEGDVNACKRYFEEMVRMHIPPTVHIYTSLIAACGRAKHVNQAWKWYFVMTMISGIKPSLETYTALTTAWTKSLHTADMAKQIFNEIIASRQKPDVRAYTALMHAHSQVFDVCSAVQVYQKMLAQEIPPNIYTYTVLIDVFAKCGHLPTALRIFEDMQQEGIVPNSHVYCTIMNAYCSNMMLTKAFALFDEMQLKGIKPDSACVNCLMDACNRTGQIDQLLQLFNQMKSEWGVQPDAWTVSILIEGCAFNGRAEDGQNFYKELLREDWPLTIRNFASYMQLLSKMGQAAEIVNVFRTMRKRNVEPDRYTVLMAWSFLSDSKHIDEIKDILAGWVKRLPHDRDFNRFKRQFESDIT